MKGLGESFSPDLHTGTANLSVPIVIPAGRNGFQPDLGLTYSSGQGNGAFGLGWTLNIPGIRRDESKGIPVFSDSDDLFLLSGAEQLVRTGALAGAALYRPRTEGLFARIQHHSADADDYWEVRSRTGLRSLYGHPASRGNDPAVLRNPENAAQVLAWHLSETSDTFGNRIEYLYERDSASDGDRPWDQLYLKTIRYADYGSKESPQYLVTVDFMYEDRPDAFSSHRGGFEVRTRRRCSRIEVRTHADAERLARAYRLIYRDQLPAEVPGVSNGLSLLSRIQVEGVDGPLREALPPLDFKYTSFEPTRKVYQPIRGSVPERSLAHTDFELADLFGRGLPDVVQIGESNRYWRNLGNGELDIPRPLESLPSGVRLGDPGTQLADFDGDGQVDLLISQRGFNGYCPLTAVAKNAARSFVRYDRVPPVAFNDPQVRLLDLDGDGVTDALRTGAQLELYFHDRKLGWVRSEARQRTDFDRFPDVYFSDPRVKVADMSGDGLQDIVFINADRVDYWPYRGNGRWGRRISMQGRIEFPDAAMLGGMGFDPRRLLLGDVDGDGLADLVYVESGRITIWLNQAGNGWSDPITVGGTPPITDLDAVRLVDFLGTGTAGVLWTFDEHTFSDSTYKFLDLCGGRKPYLPEEQVSNSGARARVMYASSTRFYLDDERDPATRWNSRLPFPVQVVAQIETIDELSASRLVTTYRYHQGFWDGTEREFRGFGVVDRFDAETFTAASAENFSPPTLTRTWFHQGQVQDSEGSWRETTWSRPWAGDATFFAASQRTQLAEILRLAAQAADPARIRQGLRALRGSTLRTELYGLDASDRQDRPYTVTESQFDVREVAPSVFFPFQVASRTTQWERGTEPMTQLGFMGEYDDYGLPRTQLSVAVPRGRDSRVAAETAAGPYLSTYTITEYAQRDDERHYLAERIARVTGYEVVNDGRSSASELRDTVIAGAASLRLIQHLRTYYDGEAFVGLPIGQLGEFGAPVRNESLAFTDDFLGRSFGSTPAYLGSGEIAWPPEYPAEFRASLPALAGYSHYADTDVPGSPGGYFVASDRRRYDFHDDAASARGLVRVVRDPTESNTTVEYDAYQLLPTRSTDALGLITEAVYDYRVLEAHQITDPNGNVAEFRFSPLGLLAAQFVRGKNGEGDADHPSTQCVYDFLAFVERQQPLSVRTVRRIHHDSENDVPAEERDAVVEVVEYSDGFGRLLQTRTQAEDVLFGDPEVLAVDPSAPTAAVVGRARVATDAPNVCVSGWQVYDNKGRVVEVYEPFFSQGWEYQPSGDAQRGERIRRFYDPRGQLLRTLNPDGSEQRVLFGVPADLADPTRYAPTPWEAYIYDTNDNAGRTHPAAAAAYGAHWNTPSSIVVDALGRTIVAVTRSDGEESVTRSSYDIQGSLLSMTDALGRVAFSYVVDLGKRRWHMDSIDGGWRDTVLDVVGNPIETRDPKGALVLQGYDSLRRLAHVWARDASAAPMTLRQVLVYGDGSSAEQSAAERAAARALNLLGKLSAQHDEAGLSVISSLDFKGNVLEKSRRVIADGPILSVFNAANWQVTPFRVDWQRAAGESLEQRAAALLETTSYQTSASFDALNRVKQASLPQDVEGRRRTLRPSYSRAGALERVFLDEDSYVDRIAYDAKGQRVLVAYGNGVMTRYAYDPRTFRLRRLRSERFTKPDANTFQPGGAPLQDFMYEFDLVGNVLSIQDRTPGSGVAGNPDALGATDPALAQLLSSGDALIRRFAYDPLYRLVSATGRECDRAPDGPPWTDSPRCTDLTKTRAYTESYAYNAAGSLTQLRHANPAGAYARDFALETTSNRLQAVQIGETSYAYTFDANGNLLAETTSRHFEWDHVDRLKAFGTQTEGAEPSIYAHYLYDASGQRVKKLVRRQGGQVEVTCYIDSMFEHHRWSGGANNVLHVMDGVKRVALVRVGPAQDGSPAVQFPLADHLGSSNVVLDGQGAVINREEFLPFGETSFGSFARKRYRFIGVERDEESGLGFHRNRYLCAWLARWASCDPSAVQGGLNSYSYCLGNPMAMLDRDGLDGVTFDPDSKMTAKEMLDLIQKDPKLDPVMKNFFYVKGDTLHVRTNTRVFEKGTKNWARVDIRRDRDDIIQFTPSTGNLPALPDWFVNVIVAVWADEWRATTMTMEYSVVHGDLMERSVLDAPMSRKDGWWEGRSPHKEGLILGFTFEHLGRNNRGGVVGVSRDQKFNTEPEPFEPRYFASAQALKDIRTGAHEAAQKQFDEIRAQSSKPRNIVSDFFHELGVHAAMHSMNKTDTHGDPAVEDLTDELDKFYARP